MRVVPRREDLGGECIVQMSIIRAGGIRQEVLEWLSFRRCQRPVVTQRRGRSLPRVQRRIAPYKLFDKHFIGKTARDIVILFLLSFGFFRCEHSGEAFWVVAKK